MIKITKEDKEKVRRKIKIIYKSYPKNFIKSPLFRLAISFMMMSYFLDDNIEFVNDIYAAYLRDKTFWYESYTHKYRTCCSRFFGITSDYFYNMAYVGEEEHLRYMKHYAEYLSRTFLYKDADKYQESVDYFFNEFKLDRNTPENKRLMDMLDYIHEKEVINNGTYDTYLIDCLLAYILSSDEIYLNEEKWKKLIDNYYDDPNSYRDQIEMNELNGMDSVVTIFKVKKKTIK